MLLSPHVYIQMSRENLRGLIKLFLRFLFDLGEMKERCAINDLLSRL